MSEMKVYEAKCNVHMPAFKCTYPRGTKFRVDGDMIRAGFQEVPLDDDIRRFIRNGILRELVISEELEDVNTQPVSRVTVREKMPVVLQDDRTSALPDRTEKVEQVQSTSTQDDGSKKATGRHARGMKVMSMEEDELPDRKLSLKPTSETTATVKPVAEKTTKVKAKAKALPKKTASSDSAQKAEERRKARVKTTTVNETQEVINNPLENVAVNKEDLALKID